VLRNQRFCSRHWFIIHRGRRIIELPSCKSTLGRPPRPIQFALAFRVGESHDDGVLRVRRASYGKFTIWIQTHPTPQHPKHLNTNALAYVPESPLRHPLRGSPSCSPCCPPRSPHRRFGSCLPRSSDRCGRNHSPHCSPSCFQSCRPRCSVRCPRSRSNYCGPSRCPHCSPRNSDRCSLGCSVSSLPDCRPGC
jgi:hypothetical protein